MGDNNGRRNPHMPESFMKAEAYQSPNRILQTKYAETFSHYKEQGQFHTPLKSDPNKENFGASPMQWSSPSMTPPPSFTSTKTPVKNNIGKNPFDANMTENLHLETFSPSVFSRVLSPSEDQDSNWRIEHVALLNPTDFSPNFHSHFTDPSAEVEAEAQEKILQFFSQKQIAPSPWSNPRTRALGRSKVKTPRDLSPTVSSKTAYTQTSLSFPPILPLEIEELLNQFCCNPKEESTPPPSSPCGDCDDSSLNASTLRRKLFTQMSGTPSSADTESYVRTRGQSSSPILMTGPHSSRFSFSPSSRLVSPPVLSPIFSHQGETSVVMDETTRQSWSVVGSQPSSYPERTVLMETYEGGYFSCSSNAVQSRETNLVDESNGETSTSNFITDKVGQPKECSTPTKIRLH